MRRFKQEKCIKGKACMSRPVKVDTRFFRHFSDCCHNHKAQAKNAKIKHMKMNQVLEAKLGFWLFYTPNNVQKSIHPDSSGPSETVRIGRQKP